MSKLSGSCSSVVVSIIPSCTVTMLIVATLYAVRTKDSSSIVIKTIVAGNIGV